LCRAKVRDETLRGRGDGTLVGHHSLRGEVCQQIKDVDVVVSVLVCITDGEVPSPKVSEPFSNGPVTIGTSTVLEDRDVAGFASGLARLQTFPIRFWLKSSPDIRLIYKGWNCNLPLPIFSPLEESSLIVKERLSSFTLQ